MELLHSGIDTLYLACQGALPIETLDLLQGALAEAREEKCAAIRIIGPGKVKVYVQPHGFRGGYAFELRQGPADPVIRIKNNPSRVEWNLFVDMGAACCLTTPACLLVERARQALNELGVYVTALHVNRIDVAFDIETESFELCAQNFVTPARMKVRAMKPEQKTEIVGIETATVCGGNYQSVTAGKMPGRQLIVYDKLREIADTGKPILKKVWGREDVNNPTPVWRVELRAGRDALSKLVTVKTTDAVFAALPDYLSTTLRDIRYLSDSRSNENVTRAAVHPLWRLVQRSTALVLEARTAPLVPEYVRRQLRERRLQMSIDQTVGNAVSVNVLQGNNEELSVSHLTTTFEGMVQSMVNERGEDHLPEKQRRTKKRLASLL